MRVLLISFVVLLLIGCIARPTKHGGMAIAIIPVSSTEDIPDINQTYYDELSQLKVGDSIGRVEHLFPGSEKECFPSGVCNYTVFEQRRIRLDRRIVDLDNFTTGIVSLLGLTCLLAKKECSEVFDAVWHVAIASAIQRSQYQSTPTSKDGVVSLIQWINIEIVDNHVTQIAVNEPLEQFKPKAYENKLPPLEEALKIN